MLFFNLNYQFFLKAGPKVIDASSLMSSSLLPKGVLKMSPLLVFFNFGGDSSVLSSKSIFSMSSLVTESIPFLECVNLVFVKT